MYWMALAGLFSSKSLILLLCGVQNGLWKLMWRTFSFKVPSGSPFDWSFCGNVLAEMACESAKRVGHDSVHSLGLFVCEELTRVDTNMGEKENRRKKHDPIKPDVTTTSVPWNDRYDPRRDSVQACFMSEEVVGTRDHPKYALSVTCNRIDYEESFFNHFDIAICPVLASDCSHCLVYETKQSKENFQEIFIQRFRTGSLLGGSSKAVLESALDFVLEPTGATASAVESIAEVW